MDQVTPREEFEEVFGKTDDHEWKWLQDFIRRNYGTLEPDS